MTDGHQLVQETLDGELAREKPANGTSFSDVDSGNFPHLDLAILNDIEVIYHLRLAPNLTLCRRRSTLRRDKGGRLIGGHVTKTTPGQSNTKGISIQRYKPTNTPTEVMVDGRVFRFSR